MHNKLIRFLFTQGQSYVGIKMKVGVGISDHYFLKNYFVCKGTQKKVR